MCSWPGYRRMLAASSILAYLTRNGIYAAEVCMCDDVRMYAVVWVVSVDSGGQGFCTYVGHLALCRCTLVHRAQYGYSIPCYFLFQPCTLRFRCELVSLLACFRPHWA